MIYYVYIQVNIQNREVKSMDTKYAVLVVDMLNDFVTGALKCDRGLAIVPQKQIGLPVIIDEYGRVDTAYPFHYLPIPERTIRRRRNGNASSSPPPARQ